MKWVLDPVFGCRVWTGAKDRDGYGRDGKRAAHLVEWERVNGKVEGDLVLDHLCRRRSCGALHHLEPVTRRENEFRKDWSHRARRKTCPKGHDLVLNAILTPQGGRVCRVCNREARSQDGVSHGQTIHEQAERDEA